MIFSRYIWSLLLLAKAVEASFHARFEALCRQHGGAYVAGSLKPVSTIFRNDHPPDGKYYGLKEPTAACNMDILRCTMVFDEPEQIVRWSVHSTCVSSVLRISPTPSKTSVMKFLLSVYVSWQLQSNLAANVVKRWYFVRRQWIHAST